ncbi:MAG: LLM class F420-dependent oxidoreductase [Acidobacteria bacterium]|nr:MAG: LLM class F420-dependent oxidoreductase [Acidobacteriota bacterium]REK07254.1 MAG: LLM class F420-dependent oxidoreductase [Acidobacteriota bacterium]
MHVGVTIFPTAEAIEMPELAREAETRGIESLWVAEHSHIPSSRKTPFPGGGELPRMYYETYDPFVALAAAAAVTERIKLGTGICLVVQRDPIHTAKEVASLDRVSHGRFLFGVGGGWNVDEMENHGTDPARRFKLMRERIEAMKEIWGHEEAEYHGELVDFGPLRMWPKPVQQPHPPIHVGGGFPGAARRAIAYGDGWIPIGGRDSGLEEQIGRFREMAGEAGREGLEVSIYGVPPKAEVFVKMQALGVDRVITFLPPGRRDEVLPVLDRISAAAQEARAGAPG